MSESLSPVSVVFLPGDPPTPCRAMQASSRTHDENGFSARRARIFSYAHGQPCVRSITLYLFVISLGKTKSHGNSGRSQNLPGQA